MGICSLRSLIASFMSRPRLMILLRVVVLWLHAHLPLSLSLLYSSLWAEPLRPTGYTQEPYSSIRPDPSILQVDPAQ